MMKQAVAAKADTKFPDGHMAPMIKSETVQLNASGQFWSERFVRLPKGMIFQDLLDVPAVWKNAVQNHLIGLRVLDRITCVAHDGTWCVKDAMVIAIDGTSATLDLKPSDRITIPSKPKEVV